MISLNRLARNRQHARGGVQSDNLSFGEHCSGSILDGRCQGREELERISARTTAEINKSGFRRRLRRHHLMDSGEKVR